MKRFLCIVLCISIFVCIFSACGVGENGGLYFKLKSLPDIGEAESSEKREYFHNGPIADFIVSENYGQIVPYISDVRQFFSTNEDSDATSITCASYGFATADGKIIVDGIYDEVQILSSQDGDTAYYVHPFIKTTESLSDLQLSSAIQERAYIIAFDGSWIKEVSSVSYSESDLKNYIEARDENGLLILYSFSGETLFSQKDAMPDDVIESVYYAKNGKFIFAVGDSEKGTRIVCVNAKGELLTEIKLGTYSILQMIGGVFTVFNTKEVEKSNLCDLNGNIILEKDYGIIVYSSQSKSFICIDNDSREVVSYDMNGQLLNSFEAESDGTKIKYILSGDSAKSIVYKDDNGKYSVYDTSSGKSVTLDTKKMKKKGFTVLTTGFGDSERSFILLIRKDGTQDLYDAFGTYIMSFTDYADSFGLTPDGNYCYRSTDGKFVVRSHSPRNDFTLDLKSDEAESFALGSYDTKYISFICTDGNGENGHLKVYDFSTKELAFDGLSAFESFSVGGETYYASADEESTQLTTASGTRLISLDTGNVF